MTTVVAPPGKPGALELADIQGNILSAYGKEGFPKARYLLISSSNAEKGRELVRWLYPMVTTAVRWPSSKYGRFGKARVERPTVALNVAFSFWGLVALGVPVRTLETFPDEFVQGMARRGIILGDILPGVAKPPWDPVWQNEESQDGASKGHILITLNAQMDPATGEAVPELEAMTSAIRTFCVNSAGALQMLAGHDSSGADFQALSAIIEPTTDGFQPTAKEHFGFTDAISDPVFSGQFPRDLEAERARGNGKMTSNGEWVPLATGEFLLGYPDEAQEIPVGGMLRSFGRNGTFMAYRKLQQNVVAFRKWIDETAPRYGAVSGIVDPIAARATLMAKIAGRWPDGAPISLFPDYATWVATEDSATATVEERRRLSNFAYFDDPDGVKCPLTSHVRRANPRDTNGPAPSDGRTPSKSGTVLTDRRRILRRGLPYGVCPADATVEGEHGIVILILCASLQRQFEFMQQQWVNYGADARAGNDTDPLIGLHGDKAKFVIPGDPSEGRLPFIADALPQFVETRGGAYFFVPSMTALQMLGLGIIDPT
ncbi:MAG: Dyp-type peroxidase [Sphingomonas sp.]|uniref:Dyp-type peroxidase n=1 Tax=Sphingomonas sp. TaxID=28214 RepID=UPI0017ABF4DE|nr:Dyp-type peroxidase domain-containing protein [Sphingomonas sp.]MBA3666617.1 Dyp-type peroxidase [Sphingomonas sp.]